METQKEKLEYIESVKMLESLSTKIRQDGMVSLVELYTKDGNKSLGSDDVRFYDLCRRIVPQLLKDMQVCAQVISGMRAKLMQYEKNPLSLGEFQIDPAHLQTPRLQIEVPPTVQCSSLEPANVKRSTDVISG
jgi:hypothetical protein